LDSLRLAAPSNKFSRPQLDPKQLLPREDLIAEKLPQDLTRKKFIILDAQAGQGKTVLAYQISAFYENISLWYQVDESDNDPFFFLAAVYQCFSRAFPDFQSPQFEDILNRGTLSPLDAKRCCNLLLSDIDRQLGEDTYLVLDDFHKIDREGLTTPVIAYFFDSSPPKLHFLITTRTPITIWCKALLDQSSVVTLRTQDLALNEHDTNVLLLSILDEDLDPVSIHQLHCSTGGWIMGIILAANPFHHHFNTGEKFTRLPPTITSHNQLLLYFQKEIFTHIPDDLTTIFLQLSLLDEIPAKLAMVITGCTTIEKQLLNLVTTNCFMTLYNDGNEPIYRLHHLFQEFLQIVAKKSLKPEKIKEIYSLEAEYYLNQYRPAQAIASHVKAGEYEKINSFLQQEGLNLLSTNRTSSIYPVMQKIPMETLLQHEWITLLTGIIQGDFSPGKSLPLLESARQHFIQKDEAVGELIALAQTIYYHFVVSGRYNTGATLLPRAEELYKQHQESLRAEVKIMVLRNLASGYWFFISDFDKAKAYATLAKDLAERQQMKNFMASTRFILGYIELLAGNFSIFSEHAEICYELLNDPLVGTSNKLTIRIMHLCYHSMTGDMTNFIIEKEALINSIDIEVTQQTVASPYLPLWEALLAMNSGSMETAKTLLQISYHKASSANSDHMTSQSLQWMALMDASENLDPSGIEEKLKVARTLRSNCGGPFYSCLNLIVIAACEILLNNHLKAERLLTDILEQTEHYDLHYLHTCSTLHLCHLYLKTGQIKRADSLLPQIFKIIKNNSYTQFWTVLPATWLAIVKHCSRKSTLLEYINDIYPSLPPVIQDAGNTSKPLLKLYILKGFLCETADQLPIDANAFTPQQRQFSIDAIQLVFWPDSPPEKARRNFDALLERMRKILADELSLKPKSYLALSKRILKLSNYKIDLDLFMKETAKGFMAAHRNRWWLAACSFNHALSLWDGSLPSLNFSGEAASEIEEELLHSVKKIARIWGSYLQSRGLFEEAARIYEKAWCADTLDDEFAGCLYRAYQVNNDRKKCWKMLDRYRKSLEKFEYEPEEIEELCTELITKDLD
jgi:LuxR family maltose regulon positive regulatory protein